MLKLLCPAQICRAVEDIDLNRLWERGIRAIILDLDNTLAEVHSLEVPAPIRRWVEDAQQHGFRLCIASNSLPRRVRAFERLLGVPAISKAIKPRRSAFLRALACMDASPGETAVVGDQLFTDILGGNRLGLYTILINPLSPAEFGHTRMIRLLERKVLTAMRRRDWITQQEWRLRTGGEGG